MEVNVEEAHKAKAYAEKYFTERDFTAAKSYALKAQKLCPQLEGISQMVATFSVYTASEVRINGELDLYAILGLQPSADKSKVKKQYKKMAVLLHPDKNKSVGADGAFKLVSEAWTILSDLVNKTMYDQRRNSSALYASGVGSFGNCSKPPVSHHRSDSFWTVCTSCHVQYEYLRKYVNKRLSCKNCRGVFIAVETGAAPANGAYQYSPWSNLPTSSVYCSSNGVSGHGSEYASNVTIQWNSFSGTPSVVSDPNGFPISTNVNHQENGKAGGMKPNGRHHMKKTAVDMVSIRCSEPPVVKPGRPPKKRKVDAGSICQSRNEEVSTRSTAEVRVANGAPAFDARRLLIDKARKGIRKKLEEIRLTSTSAEAVKKIKSQDKVGKSSEAPKRSNSNGDALHQSELKRTMSMSITVPDSDFHDFDKDRSEECFKPKQVWALYDEEDGMPRLYCLIRQVISVTPFKINISYLSSKTDSEFGYVNWLDSGFTKSCGNFRVFHSEIVDQVNIFSHLLTKAKAGRGGCVKIYPRSGDTWAVYINWSPDWNRTTPDEVRHQYEMVEVLEDYSEELGVWVTPLHKVDGYKTVYQRNTDKDSVRWIPRREMLRFSHQVPSCLLKGEAFNLTENCWDLDPAATPDGLLQSEAKSNQADAKLEAQLVEKHCKAEDSIKVELPLTETNVSA